jgi:hypothetical protein
VPAIAGAAAAGGRGAARAGGDVLRRHALVRRALRRRAERRERARRFGTGGAVDGYAPPGRWASKLDFRVGGRLKSSPEVFAQTRYRHNSFVGTRNVWRFRETVFWENREGFGSTTSLDFDRVVRQDLLVRVGGVGTFSESTQGLDWRSALLLYHNLRQARAVAGELFVRGSTGAEVELRELGTRAVYRQPVGHPNLFGELIVGYTWPRTERDQPREGSAMIGLGIELLFGRDPY